MNFCAASLLALLALLASPAASAWAEVRLPPGVQSFDVGQQMQLNGLPMQVRGFLSPQPAAQLLAWFRASLGSPLVESRHGVKTILGRAQGNHYLTVQIEPAGSGARGLVAQTDLAGMLAGREEDSALKAGWQSRLPAGMRIQSLLRARDGARQSQQLVLHSTQPLAYSRDALTRLLQQDGYALGAAAAPGAILYFHAPGREAMAVLTSNADGATGIVLNTTLTEPRP